MESAAGAPVSAASTSRAVLADAPVPSCAPPRPEEGPDAVATGAEERAWKAVEAEPQPVKAAAEAGPPARPPVALGVWREGDSDGVVCDEAEHNAVMKALKRASGPHQIETGATWVREGGRLTVAGGDGQASGAGSSGAAAPAPAAPPAAAAARADPPRPCVPRASSAPPRPTSAA